MSLFNSTSNSESGDFLPLLAYNAKAGRLKTSDRVETSAGWVKQEADVSFDKPSFVMDLANIETGWLLFRAGMAPIKAVAKIGSPMPPMPGGDFGNDEKGKAIKPREGFVLKVMDKGSVVREFASNAGAVLGSIDALHTAYKAAPEAAQGLLPVVQFTGAIEVKGKHGSNYSPNFQIIKWVPRPAALGAAPAVNTWAASVPTPTAPAQVVNQMPPPAMAAAPAMHEPAPFAPEVR